MRQIVNCITKVPLFDLHVKKENSMLHCDEVYCQKQRKKTFWENYTFSEDLQSSSGLPVVTGYISLNDMLSSEVHSVRVGNICTEILSTHYVFRLSHLRMMFPNESK